MIRRMILRSLKFIFQRGQDASPTADPITRQIFARTPAPVASVIAARETARRIQSDPREPQKGLLDFLTSDNIYDNQRFSAHDPLEVDANTPDLLPLVAHLFFGLPGVLTSWRDIGINILEVCYGSMQSVRSKWCPS